MAPSPRQSADMSSIRQRLRLLRNEWLVLAAAARNKRENRAESTDERDIVNEAVGRKRLANAGKVRELPAVDSAHNEPLDNGIY